MIEALLIIIPLVIIAAVVVVEIWPYIALEKTLHLPDSWEPGQSRGRVRQRVGGWHWEVNR